MGNKEVFHGTVIRRVSNFLEGTEDLFGVRYPDAPTMSSTITDDFSFAGEAAKGALLRDQVSFPVILRFSIPEEELLDEGPIGGNVTQKGYSTIHSVDPHILPDRYLKNLGINVYKAIRDVKSGKVEFYRVPKRYFLRLDLVP